MLSAIRLHPAQRLEEGVGVSVRRLFPLAAVRHHDPFVLWDDFCVPAGAGFPDHPHRGFEAITYLIQGSMQHSDNLGNHAVVSAGGLQCFTAGRGMIHSEMPASDEAACGIQLWINLARADKHIEPAYQQLDSRQVPEQDFEGGRKRILVGQESPLRLHTAVRFLDVRLQAGATFHESLPAAYCGLVYVLAGSLQLMYGQQRMTLTASLSALCEAGASPRLQAVTDSRFLLCFGRPHAETIHQHGSFVD